MNCDDVRADNMRIVAVWQSTLTYELRLSSVSAAATVPALAIHTHV